MAIEYRQRPVGTVAFDENTTKTLAIPRINAIRWLDMRFFIESVENNTADPTEIQDTILNIIKKVRLVIDGDANKVNVDARKLFFLEKLEKGTEPYSNKDDDHTQNTTKTWEVHLRLDFASNRLNDHDLSALLPARLFAKLDLEIDWGALTDMYSANTSGVSITDANSDCEIEVKEVIDTDNKVAFAKGQVGNGFLDLRETVSSANVSATHTNFDDDAGEHDIKPAPVQILKHLILTKDSSGIRADDTISDLLLIDTRGQGKEFIKSDWIMLNRHMKQEFGIESLDAGIVLLDYPDKFGAPLENFDVEGAIKFKNIAPTGTEVLEVLARYIKGSTLVKPANA